jgi:hypothetical protein
MNYLLIFHYENENTLKYITKNENIITSNLLKNIKSKNILKDYQPLKENYIFAFMEELETNYVIPQVSIRA